MLTFQDYPNNFRSIYRKELEKVSHLEDLLNLIDDLDKSYFVKIKNGRNIGNKVDIQQHDEIFTGYITYENTNRWLVYLLGSWDKRNIDKKNSKIVKIYEDSNGLIERYKLFLDIYKSNCISVLEGAEIPSFIIQNRVNVVKIINFQNYGEDDDWRQYKSNFWDIEFVHSKNLQSYKLKVPNTHKLGKNSIFQDYKYWQLNTDNDDVIDIIRSDEETFKDHSAGVKRLLKGDRTD